MAGGGGRGAGTGGGKGMLYGGLLTVVACGDGRAAVGEPDRRGGRMRGRKGSRGGAS